MATLEWCKINKIVHSHDEKICIHTQYLTIIIIYIDIQWTAINTLANTYYYYQLYLNTKIKNILYTDNV